MHDVHSLRRNEDLLSMDSHLKQISMKAASRICIIETDRIRMLLESISIGPNRLY